MKQGVWRRRSKEFSGDKARSSVGTKRGVRRRQSEEFGRDEVRSLAETKRGVWQRRSKEFGGNKVWSLAEFSSFPKKKYFSDYLCSWYIEANKIFTIQNHLLF